MILIITVNIQYRRPLSFQIRTGLSIPGFVLWRLEERDTILKAYANHTNLTPPQRAAHHVMFKISIHLCRSRCEKLNLTPQRKKIQLLFFQSPHILRSMFSEHDVIHTPDSFPVRGFIMRNGDCHILCAQAWGCTQQLKLNDKI